MNPLVIELIGSGILALIVSIFLRKHEKDLQLKHAKDKSKKIFINVINPTVKNTFDRTKSKLNRSSAFNSTAYYDNSYINHLHDVIDKYLGEVKEYSEYNSDDLLSKDLIKFHEKSEEAYRRGEELDILLDKMARAANITIDGDVDRIIVYYKAKEYAKFDLEEVKILLTNTRGDSKIYDLIETYYNNPNTDKKMQFKKNFLQLDFEIKKRIESLNRLLAKIEKQLS